jgi:hypothetical protein
MAAGIREEHARRWLPRFAVVAGCSLLPAAVAINCIQSEPQSMPHWFGVKGAGPETSLRLIDRSSLAPGEHLLKMDVSYPTGFPYPWWVDFAYLAHWSYPPPRIGAPLPDVVALDKALFKQLPARLRLREVDPHPVSLGYRQGPPIYGQRVVGGFDSVGAIANVSLLVLTVSLIGSGLSIYILVRRRVIGCLTELDLTVEQRRMPAVRQGLCPDCGYSVDHAAQARCPECGLDLHEVVRAGGGSPGSV